MLGMSKIVKPKLSKYLIEKEFTEEDSRGDCYDLWISNCHLNFKIHEIEFNGCKFENVDFSITKIQNVDFIDCVFEHCNLSGINFSNRSVHRCQFFHCNMVGCDFTQSGIQDVSIVDSKCDYINFSNSQIKHFLIEDSVFRDGRVVGVTWNDVFFKEVDFSKTEFLQTKLMGIDFSKCNINDIEIQIRDIKGIIVNTEQALMLVYLVGIQIKD